MRIVVDRVALGQVSVLRFSPVNIIPPMLHTHSFTYHPRYIIFLSQYFSFPCQYHSTNAPHSSVSKFCPYQRDTRASPRTSTLNNALSLIGKHWIEKHFYTARFQVLTVVSLRTQVFWMWHCVAGGFPDVSKTTSAKIFTFKESKNKVCTSWPSVGEWFQQNLRNVCKHRPNYTASHTGRLASSTPTLFQAP